MTIRETIPARELNDPIDDNDVMEAAQLILELGTRNSAVQRYFELRAYDTDVGYAAASILGAKIQRADEIKAWSNKVTISQSDEFTKELDPTALFINEFGLGNIDNKDYHPPKGGLIFFNFMFVHELMELYLKMANNSGVAPGLIAVTETTSNSFIWASDDDVLQCREMLIERGRASHDCIIIYRNGKEIVYEHGSEMLKMNLAIWKIYADYILQKAKSRHYFRTQAGSVAELTAIERLYQNYNPLGGDGNTMMKFLRPAGKEVGMKKQFLKNGLMIGDIIVKGAVTIDLRPILGTLLTAGTLMKPGTPEFKKLIRSTNGISIEFNRVDSALKDRPYSMTKGSFSDFLETRDEITYDKLWNASIIGTLNNCEGLIV